MQVINQKKYEGVKFQMSSNGVRAANDQVSLWFDVVIHLETGEVGFQLVINDASCAGAEGHQKMQRIDFDKCFPAADVPEAAIDLRSLVADGTLIDALRKGLVTLFAQHAAFTLELEDEDPECTDVCDREVTIELRVGNFVTYVKRTIGEFDGMLTLVDTEAAAGD